MSRPKLTLHTAAQVRAHADVMELYGVEFLMADAKTYCDPEKGRSKDWKYARLTFIDGTAFLVPAGEFQRGLKHYEFRLRPSKSDDQ